MIRKWFCLAFFAGVLSIFAVGSFAAEPVLITEEVARQHDLERSWFTQIDIDRGRSRLQDMKLYDGVLYAISDSAMVQAIDAETGASLWAKRIGQPEHPCLPLSVGGDMLAVVNGSKIYVANRHNGNIIFEQVVDGAPGGGPCVNNHRVYVPTTTGMIVAYGINMQYDVSPDVLANKNDLSPEDRRQLEEELKQKIHVGLGPTRSMHFQSNGRTLVQPVLMRESKDDEYVSWPTDQGVLYISRVDRHSNRIMDIVSRIQTNDAITVSPAYLPPIPEISSEFGVLFFGSNDGFVMAVREDGVLLWQFPTGEKIVQSPVAIGDRVYFSSQHEGLYCVDAKPDSATRALKHWFAPGAIKFLAANKKHVYAADRPGNVLVLDANTGEQIDSLEAAKMPTKLMNAQTDRLYLATSDGLIQCLHEVGLKEPLRYDLERKQAAEAAKPATSKKAPGKAGEKTAPDKKDGKTEEAKPETTEGGEDNPFNP